MKIEILDGSYEVFDSGKVYSKRRDCFLTGFGDIDYRLSAKHANGFVDRSFLWNTRLHPCRIYLSYFGDVAGCKALQSPLSFTTILCNIQ